MYPRRFIRTTVLSAVLTALAACGDNSTSSLASATMRIVSPAPGAAVKGPKVNVEVAVDGFKLVPANQAPLANEGHLHFFVDVPASSVPVGQVVPLDQAKTYVHAGKE